MPYRATATTRIDFQDFAPRPLPGGYEPLDVVVAAANAWIREHAVRVLGVETVLLPAPATERLHTASTLLLPTGAAHLQIVRVWYARDQTE